MEFSRHIARALHQEHVAVIALLERFKAFLGAHRDGAAPDMAEAGILGELVAAIESEVTDHFAFEEAELFPRLAAGGDGMGELLAEEHVVIVDLGRRIVDIVRAAQAGGLSDKSWVELRRIGGDYADRLIEHAQKEEVGLVPAVETMLSEDDDAALAQVYVFGR
jgi:hemerythrin-like domain-containing protein